MPTNPHPMRRDFLKTAAAGAAGAVGLSALKFDKLFAQSTGGGWVSGMQVNPAIDNRRVISCHDTAMLTATPANKTWANQNSSVNATLVDSNMDQMAMQLAQKGTAADAWSTIFRSSKPWASTRVAIKTNAIGSNTTNRPRVAIIKKICDVLVGFGVPAGNIVLFDACDSPSAYYDSSNVSLTDSTKIRAVVSSRAASMGGFAAVTLTNATGISCPADLVNGNIDILVNVAVCKMHNGTGGKYSYGTCTLCMKNHFGTFTDGAQAQHSDNLHSKNGAAGPPDALFEINKHSAVMGGNPVRQQLCIVDALLSNGASGPGGSWDVRTDRIIMGTFAPIVDYLTATNILTNATVMAASPIPQPGLAAAATILPMFLTSFGYAASDPVWIEYLPGSPPPIGGNTGSTGGTTGSAGSKASGGATASGGTTGSAGSKTNGGTTGSAGSKASGGAPSAGGTSSTGGSTSIGGSTSTGGTTSAGGSKANGGTNASGGMPANGGMTASGGTSTTSASASGGSPTTGGAMAGAGSTASPVASSGGSTGTSTVAPHVDKGSSGGCDCDVAGGDRSAGRWGAMLAFGAVVAGKLRRLVSGGDRSS